MDDDKALALGGQVWLTVGGRQLGGADRVALLAAIGEHGSITRAAKAVGMSYKGAWDAIDNMNNMAGVALVERLAGGKGGGGTRLTPRGAQLVDNFRRIEHEHRTFIEHLSRQSHVLADDFRLIQAMKMKTSARNQFSGTVSAIRRGAVNDEVTLDIVGGQRLVAIITRDSTDSLGLTVSSAAFALVKASSVISATGVEGARLSARNQLTGVVTRLVAGEVNADVSITLPGGGVLGASLSMEGGAMLGLKEGMTVTALFKASSVIVGVPG